MIGTVRKPKKVQFRLLESGHKMFYNFTSFTYLQDRMKVDGFIDDVY